MSDFLRGVIVEVFPNCCHVVSEDRAKPQKILCRYRRAQIFEDGLEWRERSPVTIGDSVEYSLTGSADGIIETRLPRKNQLHRRAPGREGKIIHTIAANIDQVFIVASARQPEFSVGVVDRFLIGAQSLQIKSAIIINKMDLLETDTSDRVWDIYKKLSDQLHVEVIEYSTHTGMGLEILKPMLNGKISVFCGHSGVGKTSVLNQLTEGQFGNVGIVNKKTGKGKHTTTVSKLQFYDNAIGLIDTPGIKEFGLGQIKPSELLYYYPELSELPEADRARMSRYDSYQRILKALETDGR